MAHPDHVTARPWEELADERRDEGECQAVCPKEISIAGIARMNREYTRAILTGAGESRVSSGD